MLCLEKRVWIVVPSIVQAFVKIKRYGLVVRVLGYKMLTDIELCLYPFQLQSHVSRPDKRHIIMTNVSCAKMSATRGEKATQVKPGRHGVH